jgi:hypothetical protein
MYRNDAPSTLYHQLNQKGARGEGTPRPGKNPEGDERGTAGTSYDNRGPATNKLTVVSAELPSVSLCANSGKTYTLEWQHAAIANNCCGLPGLLTVPPTTAPVLAIIVALLESFAEKPFVCCM